MTAFDVLQHITDPKEYAKHMMDFVRLASSDEKLIESLRYVLPKGAAETVINAADRGYPISLDALNQDYEFTKLSISEDEICVMAKDNLIYYETVFDVLRNITDVNHLSEHMKDLVKRAENEQQLEELLNMRTFQRIVENM